MFKKTTLLVLLIGGLLVNLNAQKKSEIIHDAEYYVIEAQNGDRWAAEDKDLDKRLKELKKEYGKTPNIIYILWDDMPFGDAGIPAINKIRGFETPSCNRMAEEGILFTRMYTEPSCTPTRAASLTGRHPMRNGMHIPGFPIENGGLAADEVTTAELLSQAGYATAFYGKGHLGDIEESYLNNQGFDETLFTPYNQVLSLWTPMGEGANAILGLMEDQLTKSPYQLDDDFVPRGWVFYLEGKKGEQVREWRDPSNEGYMAMDAEGEKERLSLLGKMQIQIIHFLFATGLKRHPLFLMPKKQLQAEACLVKDLKKLMLSLDR